MNEDLEDNLKADDLDDELLFIKQDEAEKKRQAHRDATSRQLKHIIHMANPLLLPIGFAKSIESCDSELKVLILDYTNRIKYLSPAVKRAIGYKTRHDTPLLNRVYSTLFSEGYQHEMAEFEKAQKERKKIRQHMVLNHREGNKIYLDSTILGYITSTKGDLIGTTIGWSKVRIHFPTKRQKNKIKNKK